ncbi:MAG: hypothetical protein WBP54_14445 [Pelodictyon phaeoclathratiforme]
MSDIKEERADNRLASDWPGSCCLHCKRGGGGNSVFRGEHG